MLFRETKLSGSFEIELSPIGDERGYFARTFCQREFEANGLNHTVAQSSFSYNRQKGTLRGLHFQNAPFAEDKLVRCIKGQIYDVMVDLRLGSPTYGEWMGFELTESNNLQLYIPSGFAHGFQTLSDDCIVAYQISQFYEPSASSGVRWDDAQIAVEWPLKPTDQSPRDLALSYLNELEREVLVTFCETKVK
jgi:dTDP-4-dehydrorhamnose 3,5-epimerase